MKTVLNPNPIRLIKFFLLFLAFILDFLLVDMALRDVLIDKIKKRKKIIKEHKHEERV